MRGARWGPWLTWGDLVQKPVKPQPPQRLGLSHACVLLMYNATNGETPRSSAGLENRQTKKTGGMIPTQQRNHNRPRFVLTNSWGLRRERRPQNGRKGTRSR